MAKNSVTDWSETAGDNTDVGGVNIAEGCAPSGINNAIRTVMSQIKAFFKANVFRLRDNTDETKLLAFDLSGLTSGTTRTVTIPDASLDLTGWATGQIKFPATQAPSSNANTLDDYEEGSWTPSVGGNSTYITQVGRYVKIGKQVTVHGNMFLNFLGTGSASTISGLPYPAASLGMFQAGSVAFYSGLAISVIFLGCAAGDNASTVRFFMSSAAGANMTADPAIFVGGARVDFSITYEAAS